MPDSEVDTYENLKAALLARLSPDTDEDRCCAREELARRRLCDGESVDELARDLEKLMDRASPDLPAAARETELHFHLMAALPEKIAFQLKLLPKQAYAEMIAKARELRLMLQRAAEPVSQLAAGTTRDQRFDRLEEAISQVSEQLAAMGTHRQATGSKGQCFRCGRPGHLARECSSVAVREIVCYRCGEKGHVARQCLAQGNDKGDVPTRLTGGAPRHN